MNAHELADAMIRAKEEIDKALNDYRVRIEADALADDKKRREMARAYVAAREQIGTKATVAHVEAVVALETAGAQFDARMAEGLKRAAGMAVDAKKQWLSALQSMASLSRAEAQISAWEPKELSA